MIKISNLLIAYNVFSQSWPAWTGAYQVRRLEVGIFVECRSTKAPLKDLDEVENEARPDFHQSGILLHNLNMAQRLLQQQKNSTRGKKVIWFLVDTFYKYVSKQCNTCYRVSTLMGQWNSKAFPWLPTKSNATCNTSLSVDTNLEWFE